MTKKLFLLCVAISLFSSLHVRAQTQLVGNSGFETGTAAPWVVNKTLISNAGYAHSGNYFCWFGGITNWVDSTYQTVTIPTGISAATLSFYYNIVSSDDPSTPYDGFIVRILDTNSPPNVLATVGTWSNADGDPAPGNPYYHQWTYDMLPFAGKTVKIHFQSQNDNLYPTSFFIDDVTLVTIPAGGPADLTPQNVSVSPNPALVGSSVTVNYTVANIGGSNAPASHTKVVMKDSGLNVFAQQIYPTAALASGTLTNESHTIGLVGATPGNYTITVTVDANSEVAQTNTVNDTSAPVPLSVQEPAGLVINPIFDSSMTSDPNFPTIQATINAAIQQYETQFSDPITVTIQFSKMSSGLGQSLTYQGTIDYTTFRAALASDAQTTNDAVALAHLPGGSANPVNGNSSVTLTTANMRALGLAGGDPPPGQPDTTISLNTSIMNLTRANPDPNKYDLMAVAQHEIDEALSMGTLLNGLPNGAATPTGPVYVMDLYRYAANGSRSFDTAANTAAYFSIDGTTDLVRFNQSAGGDFQDWYSPGNQTPRVQDAIGTPGAMPNLNVELIALDASGYNLVSAIPVPKIISAAKSGNTITLTWTSQAGLTYQLQYRPTITQAWVNLGSPITATGTTTSASDTIGASQRFYRVVVVNTSPSFVHRTLAVAPVLSVKTTSFSPRSKE
jgi:hypothetical protein